MAAVLTTGGIKTEYTDSVSVVSDAESIMDETVVSEDFHALYVTAGYNR